MSIALRASELEQALHDPNRRLSATSEPMPEWVPGSGGAAVASVAMHVPEAVVASAEIERRLGLAPDWIERRTGIRERRIAGPDERLEDHAAAAALSALEHAGVDPLRVDLVLVATTTADEIMPNAAPLVAHAIGATQAGAFDVGAACTGFVSALATGAAMIDSGRSDAWS